MSSNDGYIRDILLSKAEAEYGSEYKSHCLDIYKAFVESADKNSSRRLTANGFFITINTILIGGLTVGLKKAPLDTSLVIEISDDSSSSIIFLIACLGLLVSFIWRRLVQSYRDLNTAKFKVIHEMEKVLPFAAYDAEWEAAGRGKNPKKYLQFTVIEKRVPTLFLLFYTLLLFATIFNLYRGFCIS